MSQPDHAYWLISISLFFFAKFRKYEGGMLYLALLVFFQAFNSKLPRDRTLTIESVQVQPFGGRQVLQPVVYV